MVDLGYTPISETSELPEELLRSRGTRCVLAATTLLGEFVLIPHPGQEDTVPLYELPWAILHKKETPLGCALRIVPEKLGFLLPSAADNPNKGVALNGYFVRKGVLSVVWTVTLGSDELLRVRWDSHRAIRPGDWRDLPDVRIMDYQAEVLQSIVSQHNR